MTLDQAIAIIAEVCQSYNGTFNDHQKIQIALKTLTEAAVLNANKTDSDETTAEPSATPE